MNASRSLMTPSSPLLDASATSGERRNRPFHPSRCRCRWRLAHFSLNQLKYPQLLVEVVLRFPFSTASKRFGELQDRSQRGRKTGVFPAAGECEHFDHAPDQWEIIHSRRDLAGQKHRRGGLGLGGTRLRSLLEVNALRPHRSTLLRR